MLPPFARQRGSSPDRWLITRGPQTTSRHARIRRPHEQRRESAYQELRFRSAASASALAWFEVFPAPPARAAITHTTTNLTCGVKVLTKIKAIIPGVPIIFKVAAMPG